MERSRTFRFLRIAVTALSLTACVLLIALWVRSYWLLEAWQFPGAPFSRHIQSVKGRIIVSVIPPATRFEYGWRHIHRLGSTDPVKWTIMPYPNRTLLKGDRFQRIVIWYWMALAAMGFVATAPWLQWRFSLRTLLIATTLVAVGLGIIAVTS